MRRHVLRSAALGAIALCLGCAASPRPPAVAEYRGRYTARFEVSRFVACDVPPEDRPWWVVLSDEALRQRDSLRAALPAGAGSEVFVRWRGIAGPPEPAGHLGRSARYVRVLEILELRPVREADCGASGGPVPPIVPRAARRSAARGSQTDPGAGYPYGGIG